MALAGFAPAAYSSVSAPQTSTNVPIPGGATGPSLLVTNLGPSPAAVAMSTSTSSTVTGSTGVVVQPGQSIVLTVGTNTRIAVVALGQGNSWLNLVSGT